MARISIAIDASSLLKEVTGVGTYTLQLLRGLSAVDPHNRYVVWQNALKGHAVENLALGLNFTKKRTRVPGKLLLTLWQRAAWPCVEDLIGPVTVFHSPNFYYHHVRQARTIATIHDLFFMRHPELCELYGGKYLAKVLPERLARLDHIIAVSEHTKNDLISMLGVEPDRISVIHEGVDTRFFGEPSNADLEMVRRKYQLPPQFYLAVGTLEPRKNYPLLFQALATGLGRGQPIPPVVIVGRAGWGVETILAALTDSGANDHVQLLGYVPLSDLIALYHLALAVIQPSLYEGFGLPVLEAMAAGSPVIAAQTSSLCEICGDAALLFELADLDNLVELLSRLPQDEGLRRDYRDRGLIHSRGFTWRQAAEKTLDLYQRLAAQ